MGGRNIGCVVQISVALAGLLSRLTDNEVASWYVTD